MLDTSLQRNRLDCYKTGREKLKYQTEIELESFIVCPEKDIGVSICVSLCPAMDTRSLSLS